MFQSHTFIFDSLSEVNKTKILSLIVFDLKYPSEKLEVKLPLSVLLSCKSRSHVAAAPHHMAVVQSLGSRQILT